MKKLYILLLVLFSYTYVVGQSNVTFDLMYGEICAPLLVSFDNYSMIDTSEIIGTVEWRWYINDEMVLSGDSLTAYDLPDSTFGPGWYNVRLEVEDMGGPFWMDYWMDFEVRGLDKFHTIPDTACPDEQIEFYLPSQADWVVWRFPNGDVINQHNAYYSFPAGDHPVKVTASTECGVDSATQIVHVSGLAQPRAEIYTDGDFFCPNDEIKFDAPPAFSYEWTIDGVNFYEQQAFYAFADTAQYEIQLVIQNSCGNTDTAKRFITIDYSNQEAQAWFNMFPEDACPGQEITFEASGAGSFFWDLGDGSVAYDRNVNNVYFDTGVYNISLTLTNGCGFSATEYRDLRIQTFPENKPEARIRFDEYDDWVDTLKGCPGVNIKIQNDSWNDDGSYLWRISQPGDTTEYHTREVVHVFGVTGLHEIMMIVDNQCGGSDTAFKYVAITDTLQPNSMLEVAPFALCPGESVYFWDESGDDWYYRQNGFAPEQLTYDIIFGDGQSMLGITDPTVAVPEALAAHPYVLGDYKFTFTATNGCGNTIVYEDSIFVDNDPNRPPFYYIDNSTISYDDEGLEDWSIPRPETHEFVVGVDLLTWNNWGPQDSTVFVYFWYGHIDPNEDTGPPQGFVELHAPGTVSAYVPIDYMAQSVGIATVWYCGNSEFHEDPNIWALPMDTAAMMVQSFPTEPDGFTDLTSLPYLAGPIQMDMTTWDGICPTQTQDIQSKWIYQNNEGLYVTLGIWKEMDDSLVYDLNYGPDPYSWDQQIMVSKGGLQRMMPPGDTVLTFYAEESDPCYANDSIVDYSFKLSMTGDSLWFTNMDDGCVERLEKLTGGIFIKDDDDYNRDYDRSGCPGDQIKFVIIGGDTYEWHFEDGSTSVNATAFHTYDSVGVWEEYVIATNTCGRTDTIYTTVTIDTTNVPWADWSVDNWNIRRFQEVQFYVHEHGEDIGNTTYFWEFGDGATSVEKSPLHMFTTEGEYMVTLTTTNGCGTASETMHIYVMKETVECQAKFTYDIISGTDVGFTNNSKGENLLYIWEFGDGTMSTVRDPIHSYPDEGIYEARLMIQDTVDFCSDEVYKIIQVGIQDCFANYVYTVNDVNNSVTFSDQSTGIEAGDSWFWEFGDGTYSTEQNPVHEFPHPGVYFVCLSVQDTGCIAHMCKEVTVGAADILANFNYIIDQEAQTVQFYDNSDGTVTDWYWEFGDGWYDEVPDPVHTYFEPGIYPVCLAVSDYNTGAFDQKCKEIIITGDTTVTMTQAKFSYMVDTVTNTVQFTDQSMGATNYYWMFGDGIHSEEKHPSHTYTAPGIYPVCLIVFNNSTGQRSEICKEVTVGSLTCNISAGIEYYIDPSSNAVQFSDASLGDYDMWFWEFGDGITSTQQNPTHTFTQPGFYLVSLAVRNSINDCIDYIAEFIQVGSADCRSNFEYSITNTTDNTVQFTEKAIGTIGEYFWFFGDGNISTSANPIHSYDFAGMYNASLTVIDASGLCMDYSEQEIQVGTVSCNAAFDVYIDSLAKTAYFTNSGLGSATETFWIFGDGTISEDPNPVHTYTFPGYYLVSLTTFNESNGCMDHFEKLILIGNAGGDIVADFIYQADPSTKEVKFFNESVGDGLTYFWDFGDQINTSTLENPTNTYTEGGYHLVCLTASNITIENTECKFIKVSEDATSDCLADFIFTVDSLSKNVEFIDKSFGKPNTWLWEFDDGSTSTLQNPEHTYTDTGYYLVELRVANAAGCESKSVALVNVGKGNDGIQTAFTHEVDTTAPLTKGNGRPTDFIGTRHGGGSKLSWSFGDGKELKAKVDVLTLMPRHEYTNPGRYEVCLTIEDPITGQSDTYCDTVVIDAPTFVTNTTGAICQGETYDFFGTSLTAAGAYEHTLTSEQYDSDSTIVLDLTVNSNPSTPTVTLSGTTLTSSSTAGNQWYRDGSIITGATGSTYNAIESGLYTVIITDANGCTSVASTGIQVNLTGIDDLAGLHINIYPNPVGDKLFIDLSVIPSSPVQLEIFDMTGRVIANFEITSERNEIDMSDLNSSMYLLKFTKGSQVHIERLFKK